MHNTTPSSWVRLPEKNLEEAQHLIKRMEDYTAVLWRRVEEIQIEAIRKKLQS